MWAYLWEDAIVKVGDKVRFLNTGEYMGFDDYADCYGIIRDMRGANASFVEIFYKDGTRHLEFKNGPYFFFDSEVEVINEA
jgi:hypothetical protein